MKNAMTLLASVSAFVVASIAATTIAQTPQSLVVETSKAAPKAARTTAAKPASTSSRINRAALAKAANEAKKAHVARVLAKKKLTRETMPTLSATAPVPPSPVQRTTAAAQWPANQLVSPATTNANVAMPPASIVRVTPQALDTVGNAWLNLREPASALDVEMGDRPGRGSSMCGEGKYRKFGEVDSKKLAGLLPEFNSIRPRTVCARRGRIIADYAFK
jgi:hypothetical protein